MLYEMKPLLQKMPKSDVHYLNAKKALISSTIGKSYAVALG